MFLVGIRPEKKDGGTAIVIIKKFLKNVRNHYQPVKIIKIPAPITSSKTETEIINIYHNKDYTIHKRIFSQDKRPSKIVKANPKLIIDVTTAGNEILDKLRKAKIPIEGFRIHKDSGWKKHVLGKALGDNYTVSIYDLIDTLLFVQKQSRLVIIEEPFLECSVMDALNLLQTTICKKNKEIDRILGKFKEADTLLTLSMPIWFRENIRYSRPYRA